jgi:beta-galactosidase
MRTAPKCDDGLAFFPLFSKDTAIGGVFLERNAIVFQTFSTQRNKLIVPLPDTFFDGGEHSITIIQRGKKVSFLCDGQILRTLGLKYPTKAKNSAYLAFGPGVGTALIPKRLIPYAPTLLSAKLLNGAHEPADVPSRKALVSIDFTQPFKTLQHKAAGGHFYAYGGFWENHRGHMNPANFCMNGIIAADNTPHPGAYAFKYTQQPFDTKLVDAAKGAITVTNRYFFQSFSDDIKASWSLTADGKTIKSGTLADFAIQPKETKSFTLPYAGISFKKGVDYRAQVVYTLAKETAWAKVGHRIAWDDFPVAYTPAEPTFAKGELKVSDTKEKLTLSGSSFSVTFDKDQGALTKYQVSGKELLAGPLVPHFWRGTTDNDRAYGMRNLTQWKAIHSLSNPKLIKKSQPDGSVVVQISGDLGFTGARMSTRFHVHSDGQIQVAVSYTPKNEDPKNDQLLPRFGLQVPLADTMTKIDWYGCGPHETYIDRNYELIGRYSSTVDALFTHYSRPQETGNLSGVRSATITDSSGHGLKVVATADKPINVSARRFTADTLDQYDYSYQMPDSGKVYFHIDGRVNGVAGVNTWGAKPAQPFQLKANQPMSYQFILSGK